MKFSDFRKKAGPASIPSRYRKMHYISRRLALYAAWHIFNAPGPLDEWCILRAKEGEQMSKKIGEYQGFTIWWEHDYVLTHATWQGPYGPFKTPKGIFNFIKQFNRIQEEMTHG